MTEEEYEDYLNSVENIIESQELWQQTKISLIM